MKVGNFAKLLRRMVLSDTSSAGYLCKVKPWHKYTKAYDKNVKKMSKVVKGKFNSDYP